MERARNNVCIWASELGTDLNVQDEKKCAHSYSI
jgi:hypothetical protein